MNDYGEQQINLEPENVEQQIELEEEPVIINQGGTQNYNELRNKPSINDVILQGNKTSEELGLADDSDITDLQEQIDAITVSSDVVDVLGTYQDLQNYDTSELGDNDIVKVLQDSTHGNAMSYYRWNKTAGQWVYVGSEGPFYTKSESDTKFQDKLVSGTNIKTINNNSILGSGNIDIESGYPEVPEAAYTLYDLIEIYSDETTLPDGIYTVTQDWFIDVPKQDTYSSDSIFANSLLYINRVDGMISWSGPSSSTYSYNGDGTFFGGILNTTDDVDYAINEKLGNVVTIDTDQDITGIKTIRATDGLKFRYGSEATRTVIKPISGGMAIAYTNAQGVSDNNFEFSQGYNTSNKTLIPGNTATQDLGKSDRVWNNLYVSKLNDGTNEKSFSSLLTNNSSLIPTSSSVYTLGDNTHRWYYLYMSGNIEMQLGDINQVKSITANEYRIKDGNFNNNYYSLLKYNYGTSGKTVAQLQNGIDVNNMVIHNIPDTPDNGTSPINKNYADTNLQGKLTAGTGIAITNNVISSTLEGIDYEVDQELPATGEKGIIYLIPNGESETENIYDEYIWIPPLQEGDTGRFEFIGTTQTDLTNYVDLTSAQTITGVKTFSNGLVSDTLDSTGVLNIKQNSNNAIQIQNSNAILRRHLIPNNGNTYDMGTSTYKWNNLYLAGNLSDGTNKTTIANINNNFAPTYDNTSTYAVGDKVIYQGKLYNCTTAIDTAEDFDSAKWTEISVGSEYVDISSDQTITGAKTFSNKIMPSTNNTLDLGNSSKRWQHLYLGGSIIWGSSYIQQQGTSIVINPAGNSVVANADNTKDLGASGRRWKDLYLSGNLSDGTNSVAVANIANKNNFVTLTQAEYDALTTKDPDTYYFIEEE